MPTPSAAPSDRAVQLAQTLSRVALGDRVAFRTLYDQAGAHLLGVILRINSDRAQAEELLQEVFIKIWNAASSFDAQKAQAMTWMTSVARNRAIDSLRRRQTEPHEVRSRHSADDEEEDMLNQFASDAPGPMELLGQAVQAKAIKVCLGGLNREQQQSLALAFYEGLSHAEVAEHLGQPLGTVKSWVRRGLQGLRTCLERAGAIEPVKA